MSGADPHSGSSASRRGSNPKLGASEATSGVPKTTSSVVLTNAATTLDSARKSSIKSLKRTNQQLASINHEKMKMIIGNPRTKLVSLVTNGQRAHWRVSEYNSERGVAYMGLTTRLSQLFFNSSEESHFLDAEDVDPIVIGPTLAESSTSSTHSQNEVVHSRQHALRNRHSEPHVSRETRNDSSSSSSGDVADVSASSASSSCKCHGIEHGRLVHEEVLRLIMQWNNSGFASVRFDSSASAPRVARQYDDVGTSASLHEHSEETTEVDGGGSYRTSAMGGISHSRSFSDSYSSAIPRDDEDEPDCCTLKIIQYLACNRLYPLAAELPVFDRQCRTASAVDIVALDLETWNTVFIEVKTGYSGKANMPGCFMGHPNSGQMRNALTGISDTPLNRAAAQLLGCYLLLVMGERFDRGAGTIISIPQEMFVLHVNPQEVRPVRYPPPLWTYDRSRVSLMYEHMCRAAQLEKELPRAIRVVRSDVDEQRRAGEGGVYSSSSTSLSAVSDRESRGHGDVEGV